MPDGNLLREEYIDILEGREDKLMATGAWTKYVRNSGGELNVITFLIEKTSTGFNFVTELTVSGINTLSNESREAILEDVEAMTDFMDKDFESVGLISEDLEEFKILIDRDD